MFIGGNFVIIYNHRGNSLRQLLYMKSYLSRHWLIGPSFTPRRHSFCKSSSSNRHDGVKGPRGTETKMTGFRLPPLSGEGKSEKQRKTEDMSARLGKCSKICNITGLRHMLRWWRSKARMSPASQIPSDVPAGHVSVCVGAGCRRFVVRASYLNHPIFVKLLSQAEEEYGFTNRGPLTIPCDESLFEEVIRFISRSGQGRFATLEDLQRSSHAGQYWPESRPLLHALADKSIWWPEQPISDTPSDAIPVEIWQAHPYILEKNRNLFIQWSWQHLVPGWLEMSCLEDLNLHGRLAKASGFRFSRSTHCDDWAAGSWVFFPFFYPPLNWFYQSLFLLVADKRQGDGFFFLFWVVVVVVNSPRGIISEVIWGHWWVLWAEIPSLQSELCGSPPLIRTCNGDGTSRVVPGSCCWV